MRNELSTKTELLMNNNKLLRPYMPILTSSLFQSWPMFFCLIFPW